MRTPHPPAVFLVNLTDEQVRQVVRLALLVVVDIAKGKEWDALSKYQLANMDEDRHFAFWSLLDSTQRSTLKELAQLARQP